MTNLAQSASGDVLARLGSALCPLCNGVPAHPEIVGCKGCLGCDFTGTQEGFEEMKRLEKEAYESEVEDSEEWTLDL